MKGAGTGANPRGARLAMPAPMRSALLPALFAASLALTGCGLTGATSVVEPSFPVAPVAGARLAADALAMDPGSAKLTAIGAYAWGKFTDADRATLDESLQRMVQRLNTARPTQGATSTIHVMLRSYQVAVSNTAGTALACVAWAMTDERGEILHHEQFYATKSTVLSGTVGGLKERVNEALLERIGRNAAHLASGRRDGLPIAVADTHLSFAEVRGALPERLQAVGMAFTGPVTILWTHSGGVSWDFSRHPEGVDWPAYLASRRPR